MPSIVGIIKNRRYSDRLVKVRQIKAFKAFDGAEPRFNDVCFQFCKLHKSIYLQLNRNYIRSQHCNLIRANIFVNGPRIMLLLNGRFKLEFQLIIQYMKIHKSTQNIYYTS